MKLNKYLLMMMIVWIAFMVFVAGSSISMAQSGPAGLEQEYNMKANELMADRKYEQAASVLEELLAKQPELNNETVYRQLTHIYDDYLFNFDKALFFYQAYLTRFPEGTFASAFRDKAAYLHARRSEWPALRSFRAIQLEDGLEEVEALLSQNESSLIAPEMHNYLANKYFEISDYPLAKEHVEQYLNRYDNAGLSSSDKARALQLYADILVKQHHFGKAIHSLNRALAMENTDENFNAAVKRNDIVSLRNMSYGYTLCLLFYIAVVLLPIPIRFWEYVDLQRCASQMVRPLLLLALISLAPVLILNVIHKPGVDLRFFYVQIALSILSLLTIQLLAPLSWKTSRWLYVCISSLHMVAASFMPYYLTVFRGRKVLINAAAEFDVDPVPSLFLLLIWGSAAAAVFINAMYARRASHIHSGGLAK